MIHLFNSCYLYPDILFESSVNFVIVGKNHMSYGANIDNSLYHMNTKHGKCLGRYDCFESLLNDLPEYIKADEKTIIFADVDEFVKIYSSFLKTQVKNLNQDFYIDCVKILAAKLKIRNKYFVSNKTKQVLNTLIGKLIELTSIPTVPKIDVDDAWVKQNAGLEWKLVSNNFDNVDDIVGRYVYSHFNESKLRFLSRKNPTGTWVDDVKNQNFDTVVSMEELYNNIRKEQIIVTDKLITEFYKTKDYQKLVDNPKFLLLLKGGKITSKNWADKADIWLLRWLLKMDKTKITELGILA